MTTPADRRVDTTGPRSANRTVALVFGVVYALVGVAGFFVTQFDNVADEVGDSLLGFGVTVIHNLVHLAIGLVLIAASRRTETARAANLAIGATYVLLAVLGPAINDSEIDVFGLNGADHVLHALSGVVLAGTALLLDRKHRTRTV